MCAVGVDVSNGCSTVPFRRPQLMTKFGDVRRFAQKSSLVAFADIDPDRNDSGFKESNKGRTGKRRSRHLRKTLFFVMSILHQLKPEDDPVYQFLYNKRSEGKSFYGYMTAGGTKFLLIFYGRVRDCFKEKVIWNELVTD